ncbi:MAG: class I SAM-dependent methyltransferase [Tumebacillaceae bacterium]
MIADGAVLYREATCSTCKTTLRTSDLVHVLMEATLGRDVSLLEGFTDLQSLNILEAQASGSIHHFLRHLPDYTCFEYFDGVAPGQYKDGVMSNDLQNLSFESESFDVVITQEVLEHVADPERAFQEIARVLKPGGLHVFSVPLHEGRPTLSRAGKLKVFHGDPVRSGGAVVHTDWGDDMDEIIRAASGMETEAYATHVFHTPEEITNVDQSFSEYVLKSALHYFKYNMLVFVSQKPKATGEGEEA